MATKPKGKAAAAPAPQDEGPIIEVGSIIRFLGYPEGTPEAEQILEDNSEHTVTEVGEDRVVVQIENPDFNAKAKEHPEKNPKLLELEILDGEYEVVEEEPAQQEAEAAAEAAPEKPARAAAKNASKPAPAAKTASAAKTAAKGTTEGKAAAPAPAKGKAKAEAEAQPDEDDLPDLENEDPEVLALVEGSEDLIGTAQSLGADIGATEWKVGGLLHHIRKNKLHREVVDEKGKVIKAYSEKGGFGLFVEDFFNFDYRKAMHLIGIYESFTQAGIENPADVLASIGWTKASKLSKYLVADGASPTDLIELAQGSTVQDLSEALKDQTEVGGTRTAGEKVARLTLKFKYLEADANNLSAILDTAKEQFGLKDPAEAMLQIATEWATANAGGEASAEAAPTQRAPVGRAAPKSRARAAA